MSEEVLAELRGLKPSALKKRAREAGVDDDAMDETADADDPKEALIALVLAAAGEAAGEGGGDEAGEAADDREASGEPASGEVEPAATEEEGGESPDASGDDVLEAVPGAREAASGEGEPAAGSEPAGGDTSDAGGDDILEAEPTARAETTTVAASEQDSVESPGADHAVDATPGAETAADSAGDDVPEGVPPGDSDLTKEILIQLGSSIGWDEDMVAGTLSAMDDDLEQCAALLREQGATAEPATEPKQLLEPQPEPEQEQGVDEQETSSAASEEAELDSAKNALFAGAAPKKKRTATNDEDAALAEAKGALFGGAKPSGGSSKKPKPKAKAAAKSPGTGLGLARDSNEPENEEPVRSLDDLDAGDMSMMTIDEELTITQARLESGKTYYQILWTEQGGNDHDVWRRYSEFDALRKKMSGKKGGHPEIKTLHFPGKTKLKSKGNSETVVDDRQGHLQAWLQQLVMAKQLVPDSEGDNAQKMLYDFLSGDSEPEFHKMMTNGVPEEGSMKAIGNYD